MKWSRGFRVAINHGDAVRHKSFPVNVLLLFQILQWWGHCGIRRPAQKMSTNIKPNKIISRWRERNAEVCLLGSHEQRDGLWKGGGIGRGSRGQRWSVRCGDRWPGRWRSGGQEKEKEREWRETERSGAQQELGAGSGQSEITQGFTHTSTITHSIKPNGAAKRIRLGTREPTFPNLYIL